MIAAHSRFVELLEAKWNPNPAVRSIPPAVAALHGIAPGLVNSFKRRHGAVYQIVLWKVLAEEDLLEDQGPAVVDDNHTARVLLSTGRTGR